MFSNERLKRSTSHEKDMAARSAAAALAPPRPLATHRTAGGACVSALATRGARKAGGDGRMQTAVLRGMPASAKVTCRGHTIFPRTRRSIRVAPTAVASPPLASLLHKTKVVQNLYQKITP